jgi:nucleotide-binding universal stress UspA family protein
MDLNNLDRVLVPIDFSELCFKAIHTALSIAPPERIHLLHVTPVASGLAWAAGLHGAADDRARVEIVRIRLDRELDGHALEHGGMHVHVRVGSPSHAIVDFANSMEPDLVIIGSHGHTGAVGRLLMGSVAYSIVRSTHAPVLVVR